MDTYVGLDVSLRETAVCVVDESGAIQLERSVAADPDVIAALLHAQAPTMRRVGLESGPTSVWLWRALAERGLPVICIDARPRESGSVYADQQERPQRRGRHCAHHANRLVSPGSDQVTAQSRHSGVAQSSCVVGQGSA